MTQIGKQATDGAHPYANLLPIVDFLGGLGNIALDGGFLLSPAGWSCRMQAPIDFDALRAEFEFPATIKMSARYDTILDTLSWCAIEGPGAEEANLRRAREHGWLK